MFFFSTSTVSLDFDSLIWSLIRGEKNSICFVFVQHENNGLNVEPEILFYAFMLLFYSFILLFYSFVFNLCFVFAF